MRTWHMQAPEECVHDIYHQVYKILIHQYKKHLTFLLFVLQWFGESTENGSCTDEMLCPVNVSLCVLNMYEPVYR